MYFKYIYFILWIDRSKFCTSSANGLLGFSNGLSTVIPSLVQRKITFLRVDAIL